MDLYLISPIPHHGMIFKDENNFSRLHSFRTRGSSGSHCYCVCTITYCNCIHALYYINTLTSCNFWIDLPPALSLYFIQTIKFHGVQFSNSSWMLFRVRIKLLCQNGRCNHSKLCSWRGHGAWFGMVDKALGTLQAACSAVGTTAN
jgi:hypothetical protein